MNGIDIMSIHDIFGQTFDYDIKTPNPALGDQLHIFFKSPLMKNKVIDIVMEYHTTSK